MYNNIRPYIIIITCFNGVFSEVAYINASIMQGSVAPDLQPKHRFNILLKYADDALFVSWFITP